MHMVRDRHVSSGIRELGYDIYMQTMAVVLSDKTMKYHAPLPYSLYASIFHVTFPERLYKQTVEGHIPAVTGS